MPVLPSTTVASKERIGSEGVCGSSIVLSHQAWSLRTSLLVRIYQGNEREGAYWGIGTPISRYDLPDQLAVPDEVTERLAKIRTRLNAFSEEEQCTLINWGYAVCDAAVRKYTRPPKSSAPQWPYPNCPLSQGIPGGVQAKDTADFVQPVPQPKEPPQLPCNMDSYRAP